MERTQNSRTSTAKFMKKHIHFVGIKGVGMTPLAIIAKEAGITVTGCDIGEEFITDEPLKKAGITPMQGFSGDHLKDVDIVIATGAHGGYDNPEVQHAKMLGIPIMTQGQAVGAFMEGKMLGRNFTGISVAGSHGKTTTTAMIATILKASGQDPTFVIGTGLVPSLDSSGHFGKGQYFIAEADEYATEPNYDKTVKFLWQHPKILVITNIEFDHPDLFPSIDAIREAFLVFTKNLSKNGVLIACGDDSQVQKLLQDFRGDKITYGFGKHNDFILENVRVDSDKTFFTVVTQGRELGKFMVGVSGEHNALNALAANLASMQAGVPFGRIQKAISLFTGTKRRFERKGTLSSGAILYDDYAHHPTEIRKTLRAFRESFPNKRIICIFQPHTYSRTKILFEQFIRSFYDATEVIFTNIYSSLREEADPSVSSEKLANAMVPIHTHVRFLPNLTDVVKYVNAKRFDSSTIVITMGAGNIYKIADAIVHSKS